MNPSRLFSIVFHRNTVRYPEIAFFTETPSRDNHDALVLLQHPYEFQFIRDGRAGEHIERTLGFHTVEPAFESMLVKNVPFSLIFSYIYRCPLKFCRQFSEKGRRIYKTEGPLRDHEPRYKQLGIGQAWRDGNIAYSFAGQCQVLGMRIYGTGKVIGPEKVRQVNIVIRRVFLYASSAIR